MSTKYGVYFRAEFLRPGAPCGDKKNPVKDLYFKVLPKGAADVPGILLGFPHLDHHEFGLGWKVCENTHYFSALSVHMPRTELRKREQHLEQVEEWENVDASLDARGRYCERIRYFRESSILEQEHCFKLSQIARCHMDEVCAYSAADCFELEPSEEALVPASWGGGWRADAPDDVYVQQPDHTVHDEGIKVLEGIADRRALDFMLCIKNESQVTQTVERGAVLGIARRPDPEVKFYSDEHVHRLCEAFVPNEVLSKETIRKVSFAVPGDGEDPAPEQAGWTALGGPSARLEGICRVGRGFA